MPSTYRLVLANAVIFISLHRLYCHSFVFVLHLRLIPHACVFDFFFSFYICDLKNSYADHRVTSPVFTGPNLQYIHPPSVDLCNSCSIWCVRVSDISAVIFTSLSSSHSKAWSESPTLYAWQPLDIPHTHGWSCLFCWLTGCVCVYVCVCWLCDCVIVVLNEASWVSHPICHLCRRCYKGPWEMQSWRLSPPPYVSRGSSQSTCHC